MKDMGRKIAEKAIERQFEIMAEQQKKGEEFVNERVREKLRPESNKKTSAILSHYSKLITAHKTDMIVIYGVYI